MKSLAESHVQSDGAMRGEISAHRIGDAAATQREISLLMLRSRQLLFKFDKLRIGRLHSPVRRPHRTSFRRTRACANVDDVISCVA